jgi:hypothetical protein
VSAAAGRLAPQALRAALLDGPAGADPAGVALVGLLEAVGLLACPEFAGWCVYFDDDGYAEIDLAELACWWMAPVELTDAQCQTVRAALSLVDLAAELRELPEPTRRLVVDALAAFVADIAVGDATAEAYRAAVAAGPGGGGPR